MITIFQAEYYSNTNNDYVIEILDNSASPGLLKTFNVTSEGFVQSWMGSSNDALTRIIPSTGTIIMMVEDSDHQDFITNLAENPENSYWLKVSKNSSLLFVGKLFVDDIVIEDQPYPYAFQMSATDGLAALKDIEFDPGSIGPPATLLTYIYTCLESVNTSDYYTTSIDYMKVSANWYDTNHSAPTIDPIENTYIHRTVFLKEDTNGHEYWNCWDIITEILQQFNCRLIYSEGCYIIEQIQLRKDAVVRRFVYDIDRTLLRTDSDNDDITIDQSNFARLSGGTFAYLPALRSVTVKHNHDIQDQVGSGYYWNETKDDDVGATNTYTLYNITNLVEPVKLRIKGTIKYTSESIESDPFVVRKHRFGLQIACGGGSKYWNRDFDTSFPFWTNQYLDPSWENSGTYDIVTSPVTEWTGYREQSFVFETALIPATGDITIYFTYVDTFLDNPSEPFTISENWNLNDIQVELIGENHEDNLSFTEFVTEINTDNSKTLKIETVLGDAPAVGGWTGLLYKNGSSYLQTTDWAIEQSGTNYDINALLSKTIGAMFPKASRLINGGIYASSGDHKAHGRYVYDSGYFIFINGEYRTNDEDLRGDFFQVLYEEQDPEEPTDIFIPDPTGPNGIGAPQLGDGNIPSITPISIMPPQDGETGLSPGIATGLNSGMPYEITTLAEYVENTETNVTSFTIPTAPNDLFNAGDEIEIVNPYNKKTQTATVAVSVSQGDSVIQVENLATIDIFLPYGSFIKYQNDFIARKFNGPTYETYANQSGTTLAVTASLPDPATHTAGQISRKITVYRNGLKLIYGHAYGYGIDVTGVNNLTFTGYPLVDADIEIFIN